MRYWPHFYVDPTHSNTYFLKVGKSPVFMQATAIIQEALKTWRYRLLKNLKTPFFFSRYSKFLLIGNWYWSKTSPKFFSKKIPTITVARAVQNLGRNGPLRAGWLSNKMPIWRANVINEIWLILNYSKVVWDIFLKFSPLVYHMFVLIWWKNFFPCSIGLPATAHFCLNFGQL